MQVEEITQILRESPSVRLIKSRSMELQYMILGKSNKGLNEKKS